MRSRSSKSSRSSGRSSELALTAAFTRTGGPTWKVPSYFASRYFDPFPNKGHYRLRYSQVVDVDAAQGLNGHNLFRLNSIYDPDYTGVGHQPYGRDNLAAIYNHYVVDSAVITVTPTSTAGDFIYGLGLTDDVVVNASYDTIREQKGFVVASSPLGPSGEPQTLSRTYNRRTMWPIAKDTSAAFGTNPSEEVYGDLFIQGKNSAGNPATQSFLVNITYMVMCYELKDLGQS